MWMWMGKQGQQQFLNLNWNSWIISIPRNMKVVETIRIRCMSKEVLQLPFLSIAIFERSLRECGANENWSLIRKLSSFFLLSTDVSVSRWWRSMDRLRLRHSIECYSRIELKTCFDGVKLMYGRKKIQVKWNHLKSRAMSIYHWMLLLHPSAISQNSVEPNASLTACSIVSFTPQMLPCLIKSHYGDERII